MNKFPVMMPRLIAVVFWLLAMSSLSAQPLDVSALDRHRILNAAEVALGQAPLTITKFHAELSDGGPNDFYSSGDYWWPNPNTTNGLPYINRDGQTNPDNFVAHRQVVQQLSDAIAALRSE